VSTSPDREVGVDVARGLGVFGVVLVHSFIARGVWVPARLEEWAGLGIVVLFMLMGVVLGIRVAGKHTRASLTWSDYLSETRRRLMRFIPGFAVAWLLTLVLGVVAGTVTFGPATLIGMLPVPGPGNYFIPVLLTWVLITPLVAWGSQRSLNWTAAILILADVIWWPTVAWRLPHMWSWSWVGGWGMMLGVGLWLGARGLQRSGRLVVIASLVLMVAYLATPVRAWLLLGAVGVDNSLNELVHHAGMSLYAAAFVIVTAAATRRWPCSAAVAICSRVGRATWIIFLINMVWFGVLSTWLGGTGYGWVAIDLAGCVLGGIALSELESRWRATAISAA